jgi:glycosyltransferase involved in cell wall biosynthesis
MMAQGAFRTARLASSKKGYGGSIYERMVDRALAEVGEHEVVGRTTRFRGALRVLEVPLMAYHWARFARRTDAVLIRTQYTALFDYSGRGVTIIHHVDSTQSRPVIRLFESLTAWGFFSRRRFDEPVVVVAEYWRDVLRAKGYRNVHVIYSGFRLADYEITEAESADFRERYGFGDARIVYIGNPQKKKGADLCYAALKDSDFTLVTTGVRDLDLPVRHLELPFRDYLCLLHASDVVMTMSRFKEGWNRVAHEAMLVGTPVIGSGMGGMRELLLGGGQLVCEDPSRLQEYVERAVRDRAGLREQGRRFARTFSVERFERDWRSLIQAVSGDVAEAPRG